MYFGERILIAAAIIPAVLLLLYVYKKDRLEKESTKLLLILVVLGILSTLMASATENAGIAFLPFIVAAGSTAYNIVLYYIVVGLSEEGFKYLVMRWKTWRNPEFNCQFDGVVYSVFVALGFALFENIMYVFQYGFATAVARAVTAVPGHACFGVFMGVFYGAAKRLEKMGRKGNSKACRLLAVIIPMFLHGTYDFLASSSASSGYVWSFVVFVIALFFAAYLLVKKLSANDSYM